jgi:hypothetical protein
VTPTPGEEIIVGAVGRTDVSLEHKLRHIGSVSAAASLFSPSLLFYLSLPVRQSLSLELVGEMETGLAFLARHGATNIAHYSFLG